MAKVALADIAYIMDHLCAVNSYAAFAYRIQGILYGEGPYTHLKGHRTPEEVKSVLQEIHRQASEGALVIPSHIGLERIVTLYKVVNLFPTMYDTTLPQGPPTKEERGMFDKFLRQPLLRELWEGKDIGLTEARESASYVSYLHPATEKVESIKLLIRLFGEGTEAPIFYIHSQLPGILEGNGTFHEKILRAYMRKYPFIPLNRMVARGREVGEYLQHELARELYHPKEWLDDFRLEANLKIHYLTLLLATLE